MGIFFSKNYTKSKTNSDNNYNNLHPDFVKEEIENDSDFKNDNCEFVNDNYDNYENIENEFKELLYVIDETNDIMHFYKSIKDSPEINSNEKLQEFSERSIKYFEYFKDTSFEDYETHLIDFDVHIKNYYDMAMFVNKAEYFYENAPEHKKKYLLNVLFNLLHSTIYSLVKVDLMA